MKRRKISIIGAGHVGGTVAQRLAEKSLADVVLVDIDVGAAQGKALDLTEAAPLCGYDVRVLGSGQYEDTAGSDLVIITSGVPRKPGMSRDDLLKVNTKIIKEVTEKVVQVSPEAILLMVSNPLDAMTYLAYKVSGFPRQRVVGMAGVLDSARLSSFIAMELKVSVESVQSMVLGGHGDTMVPLLRWTRVSGVPVTDLIPMPRLQQIIKRTRDAGAEIVSLLKTGSAYYAPSAAVVKMAEAIILDRKAILPCAALCEDEYGIQGLFVGVPGQLGHGGVEKIVELPLDDLEKKELKRSVVATAELCRTVDKWT